MTRTLRVLIGIVIVLAVAYGVKMAVYPDARPGWPTWITKVRRLGRTGSGPASYDNVVVTLVIPAQEDVLTGGARRGHCPKHQLGNILGITVGRVHGIVVRSVVPDGLADKAGIKPGDSLAHRSVCPRDALPEFEAGAEPREIELIVRRPAESTRESAGAE